MCRSFCPTALFLKSRGWLVTMRCNRTECVPDGRTLTISHRQPEASFRVCGCADPVAKQRASFTCTVSPCRRLRIELERPSIVARAIADAPNTYRWFISSLQVKCGDICDFHAGLEDRIGVKWTPVFIHFSPILFPLLALSIFLELLSRHVYPLDTQTGFANLEFFTSMQAEHCSSKGCEEVCDARFVPFCVEIPPLILSKGS